MRFSLSTALLVGATQLPLSTAQSDPPTEAQTGANDPALGNLPRSRPYYPSPWSSGAGDWADAYAKAQAFVKQLTLLEKVNITTGSGWQSNRCVGNVGSVPRLGLHSLCLQDGPLGIRLTDYNSAYPAGGTSAASWDRGTWYKRGFDMGSEFREKGIDIMLGPAIGPLGRMPAGGRNWEGFSPDPFLTGIAVAETVRGIQDAGVIATTKHFILNEQEYYRQVGESVDYGTPINDTLSSNIDDKTMHELYLWPFADAVRAGTGAVMCSYQQINNSYGCQNSYTMNHLLKNELGFQGFVMTDWQAHQSGVDSALAGVDMSMPGDTRFNTGDSFWGANLTIAVLNGSIPAWRLDDAATRIMAAWYYVGRNDSQNAIPVNYDSWTLDTFGNEQYYGEANYGLINEHKDVRQEHGRDIRHFAAQSTVLLKNKNGTLPLTGKEKFTAVFGEDAEDSKLGPNGCPNRGCDNGTLAMGWGSGTAEFPYLVSPLEAIKNEVLSNYGVIQSITDNYAYDLIQTLARQASAALVFVNSQSGEGFINFDGNRGDRRNLTLWLDGDTLIRNVSANCNNTIVVIHSVGPVIVEPWVDHENVTAILWAGLPGEQSGNAIADVLYGRVNPGGKLPFTIGKTRGDYGTDVLYERNNGEGAPQQTFTEGVYIDYRHFDRAQIEPRYEFGYGLSYTTFELSNLQIQKLNVGPYVPASGNTQAAPVLGTEGPDTTDYAPYVYPANWTRVNTFIYPYINSTNLTKSSGDVFYGTESHLPENAQNGAPQPRLPASGAPGGNPQLWDVLATVKVDVTNTGDIPGEEVAQVYVSLGGDGPVKQLRGFERVSVQPGQTVTVNVDLNRRDLSSWSVEEQNWVIASGRVGVSAGTSSRVLPLEGGLEMGGY